MEDYISLEEAKPLKWTGPGKLEREAARKKEEEEGIPGSPSTGSPSTGSTTTKNDPTDTGTDTDTDTDTGPPVLPKRPSHGSRTGSEDKQSGLKFGGLGAKGRLFHSTLRKFLPQDLLSKYDIDPSKQG